MTPIEISIIRKNSVVRMPMVSWSSYYRLDLPHAVEVSQRAIALASRVRNPPIVGIKPVFLLGLARLHGADGSVEDWAEQRITVR